MHITYRKRASPQPSSNEVPPRFYKHFVGYVISFLYICDIMEITDKYQRLLEDDVRPLRYLKRIHNYFLDFQFPRLRNMLVEYLKDSDVGELIVKHFDSYVAEVGRHMKSEEKSLSVCAEGVVAETAKSRDRTTRSGLSKHHEDFEKKFSEFINIMQMYRTDGSDKLLEEISCVEEDLLIHCLVEDMIFMPSVERMRKSTVSNQQSAVGVKAELSEREQDIAIGVAKGLSNKEIADKLFLSVNTVTTHRRNIAKKLHIHSPAGLTIYCIVNNLVDITEIKI